MSDDLPPPTVSPHTVLYDPKDSRKTLRVHFSKTCPECGIWCGHRVDCGSIQPEDFKWLAKLAQDAEKLARERSDRYWKMLQSLTGKYAIVRHENNKLRKANDRLRAELKSISGDKAALSPEHPPADSNQ